MISRREVCHSYLVVGKGKNMSYFSKRAWRNISTNAFPERTHRVVSFPDPLAGRFYYNSYMLRPALCAQRIDITNHLFLCNTKEVCDFSIHIESSIFDTLPYMNWRNVRVADETYVLCKNEDRSNNSRNIFLFLFTRRFSQEIGLQILQKKGNIKFQTQ